MRCPKCDNTALGEDYAFCQKCGTKLKANEEATSPPVDDEKTPATNAKDLTCTTQNSDFVEEADVSLGKML